LTGTLNELLERRDSLTKERDEATGSLDDVQLSAQIVEINSKALPDLKKQVKDMFNSAKGAQKHQLAEIIGAIESALQGIETVVVVDVSETRLKSLQEEQRNCKTGRQAKAIESQISQIRWANKQWGKQQKLLANEEELRRRNEEEITRLDSILYGHLRGSGAEPQQNP
jgi:Fe-S cluster biosynthesis and repair protein YggX